MTLHRFGACPAPAVARARVLLRSVVVVLMAAVAGMASVAVLAAAPAGAAGGTPGGDPGGVPAQVTSGPYYVALGDSLAAGVGATTSDDDYVNLVAQHEQARFPGLQVENLSCGGATTGTMLDGGGACTYQTGTQLGDAEAFLQAHPGQVAFLTIDIGANNVDDCLTGTTVDISCVAQGEQEVESQLPQIVAGLQAADPGLPIFAMNYYDPFLALWLDSSSDQGLADLSVTLADTFDDLLANVYGAAGIPTADVSTLFQTDDEQMTGSYQGQVVPQDVADICAWTHMCTNETIHTNDTGHALLAQAFERDIDAWFTPGGQGTLLAGSSGQVYALGDAELYGSMDGETLDRPVVGTASTSGGGGYWLVAADGGVFSFGDAAFDGSMGGQPLNAPVVGMAATPTGGGYWLVAADGGVFAFGAAAYEGSMGGQPLNAPVVGMAATPTGGGYWLVAADGGVFAFGAAAYEGSMGGQPLNAPVVGMAATPTGGGYWLVAADGGVFAFGAAAYEGSMGGQPLNAPVVGMAATPTGGGYWLVAADGGVFAFGAAAYEGSLAGTWLRSPVVAVADVTLPDLTL